MKKNNFKQELKVLAKEITCRNHSVTWVMAAILLGVGSVAASIASIPQDDSTAANCTSSPCNTSFKVHVQDAISVTLTSPSSGASGNVNTFLRNKVSLAVNSNVTNGFTASMYSSDSNAATTKTYLTHTSLGTGQYLPTLSAGYVRSAFPTNYWGYSLASASIGSITYGETDAGNENSRYYGLADKSAPITILTAASGTKQGSQSIYFGAKANTSKASGTYSNTVVFSVVTGAINSNTNPAVPVNPATPSMDTPNNSTPTYTGTGTTGVGVTNSSGTTIYTTTSTSGSGANATSTTKAQVSGGNNTPSYTYTTPQGVITSNASDTQTNIVEGSSLPIGLAATAGAAATAGVIFFIVAKKRDDDDDEEEDA